MSDMSPALLMLNYTQEESIHLCHKITFDRSLRKHRGVIGCKIVFGYVIQILFLLNFGAIHNEFLGGGGLEIALRETKDFFWKDHQGGQLLTTYVAQALCSFTMLLHCLAAKVVSEVGR